MKTNFKIGDKVKIIDDGHVFSTYEEMAEKMNLTKWKSNFSRHNCNDKTGVIVSIQTHFSDNTILAGVDLGEEEIIIRVEGLELLNDTPEKWCIEITRENKHILYPWWKENAIDWGWSSPEIGYTLLSIHPDDPSMYYCSDVNNFLLSRPEYELITFEQFKTITSKTTTPSMDTAKTIQIARHLLNDYYNASTTIQKQFINDNFKIDGTTTVEAIIGLHDLACDRWKDTIKRNHPECFPVTKTAIELAVEKAGLPDYSGCNVKIKGNLILVDLPGANTRWSFAAFEWVMKFCKENPQCYPIHKNENNNTDYLYIQWYD